jgi:hypothetical protein
MATVTTGDIGRGLTDVTTEYETYKQRTQATESTQTSNTATTATNTQLELELRELKRQLQKQNKQYLDASETKTATTLFQRIGLSSFEDWAIAGFFAALGLFCLVTTGYLASLSTFPMRVTVLGLILTGIVLAGAGVLIRVLG